MEIKFITEEKVNHILSTEFPAYLTLAEARERLELEIYMAAQEMAKSERNKDVRASYDPDNEETCVAISPMWISIALNRMIIRQSSRGKA